jgi:hypothetical protein
MLSTRGSRRRLRDERSGTMSTMRALLACRLLKRINLRRWAIRVMAVVALTGPLITIPTVASAVPPPGCQYPYVCVYTGQNGNYVKVGQFKDATNNWQTFSRTDITYAYNSRNANVAYFLYSKSTGNGAGSCIQPGRDASLEVPEYGYVTAIRISQDREGPKCFQR